MKRREFIKRAIVSAFLLVTGIASAYEVVARSRASSQTGATIQQQSSQTSTSQIQAPAGYVFVTPVSSLSGKTSAYFQHPSYGASILVLVSGQWKAFSATCTHQPCTVQYGGTTSIRCPCHGATFSTANGAVLGGPAPRPLPEYGVQVDAGGNLFVTTTVVN